jgi:hypothetical protein
MGAVTLEGRYVSRAAIVEDDLKADGVSQELLYSL